MSTQLQILDHPGRHCKLLRELRLHLSGCPELTIRYLAQQCHVSKRTIEKFERGESVLNQDAYKLYVSTLDQAFRLTEGEKLRLMTMYASYVKQQVLERELSHYNFNIVATNRYLLEAVKLLTASAAPAFIMDELGYTSVLNRSLVELFRLDEQVLYNPLSWHAIATKYHPASPVRQAHEMPYSQYFSFAVRQFHNTLAKYFYTQQALGLQQELLHLSPKEYGEQWLSYLLMTQPEANEQPYRIIRYQNEQCIWSIQPRKKFEVAIYEGPVLLFHLLEWIPLNGVARTICDEFAARRLHEVTFAREYGLDDYKLY